MVAVTTGSGPLAGVHVVELAGIGPAPFAGMLLADLGATVLRVDRIGPGSAGNPLPAHADLLNRGKASVAIDLKHPAGVDTALRLVDTADVLIEGFRPGVTERLGVGPDVCLDRNPRLVYGRMTGWGQDGPWAQRVGHDINYIALSGALAPIGPEGQDPCVPLNVVGDFGGGGMMLALGVCAALTEARSSGQGQVVDAAIVDGASLLMTMFHALRADGQFRDERGTNLLDGGAHFYGVYRCSDDRHVSVGAIEPQFYAALLAGLGLSDDEDFRAQHDRGRWPVLRSRLAALFATRTRDEWCALFDGTDACVAPVLGLGEVATHPHNHLREAYSEVPGGVQPNAAPRFSRTTLGPATAPPTPGADTVRGLRAWGFDQADIESLIARGAVAASAATAGEQKVHA